FDDNHMIVENVFIKSAKYFSEFFKGFVTSYPIPKGMCRPLLMLTFGFNYSQGGLSPIGYHIINILFHFLNACLLYFLLKFLNKSRSPAAQGRDKSVPRGLMFIITLLFVVHPLNTEAVTYISSRSDLMVTFFILSGFFLYLKGKYTLTCLMYIAALLTKETALCFPILILGYYLLFHHSNSHLPRSLCLKDKKIIFFIVSLIAITLSYCYYYETFYSGGLSTGNPRSLLSNTLIQSWVAFFYLKLFLWPCSLNILHWNPSLTSLFQIEAYLALLGLTSLIILIFILRKAYPLVSLGIFWYTTWLLPKFYARLDFVACEHHFYLPSIGAYIVLTVILSSLYLKRKKYFLYISAGVISLFSLLTFLRNYEYKDAVLFWKISSQRNPKSAYIHNEVGREYLKRNKLNRAEGKFKKALMFSKRAADTIISKKMLSAVYYHKKNYHQAEKLLNELLKLNPPPPGTYEGLGKIYLEMAKEKEAITFWNKELSLYPQRPSIYVQFGLYYLKKKEFIKAEDFFQKARQKNPDFYLSYYGLGKIWENNKDYDKAIKYYQKALSLNPACAYSHYALGRLYGKMGNFLALGELEKTIELDSNFARAHNDLAVLYASMNPPNWELAKKHIEIAKALGYSVKKTLLKEIGDGELKNR
ncbi:MAG: tetratricopeptide repeat protein, partial [Candidatus Omnitrophica bacterium]|nr:tetratricopeptide repeat protein [Candidatus Omnitrophota bacterium]